MSKTAISPRPVIPAMLAGAAVVLFATPALSHNMSSASARNPASTTIALSQKARAQVDASAAQRVRREFDFSLGDITHILTPAQLRAALGVEDPRMSNAVGPAGQQLERIEVHATRKEPVATPIPFGFASIAWAVKHPAQAWRVFTPVVFG